MGEVMRQSPSPRDLFGKLLIEEVRGSSVRQLDISLAGEWRDIDSQRRFATIKSLTAAQTRAVRELGVDLIDTVLHSLLFMIESHEEIEVLLRTKTGAHSIRPGSGDLQGELFGDDGWISRFAKDE
jgi:hypothetical protein